MEEKKTKKGWIWVVVGLAIILVLLAFSLTRCSSAPPQWQEHYDLGMRYLSEGNYQEAILAFSAAIEIDPNVSDHYLYRGDAYVLGARDMLGQEEPDCDQAVVYLQSAESDYRKAQELNENADITGRMEEVETLEEEVEILTAVPEEIPFYEEAGLEINTSPDTTEKTDELAVRQAGWTVTLETETYYGSQEDWYQLSEHLPGSFSVTAAEYAGDITAKIAAEADEAAQAFLAEHEDYKLIIASYSVELGRYKEDYDVLLRAYRCGVIDRDSGVAFDWVTGLGAHTLNHGGSEIAVYYGVVPGSTWYEGDVVWGVHTEYMLVPRDYDGAVFYIGGSNKEVNEALLGGTGNNPLYSDLPGSDLQTYFFALPEE